MRCLPLSLMVPALLFAAPPVHAQLDTLVAPGAIWSYLDDGTNQGSAWRAPSFDDSSWATGPAQLGYGDGDEATVVSYGPDADNKYITTYFRHEFNVASVASYVALQIEVLRDDGAVVYLNGTEVVRSNMPIGGINYNTFASSTVSGGAEDAFYTTTLEPGLLQAGNNVLAVEVHQRVQDSSDISLDFALRASDEMIFVRGPYLQNGNDNAVTVCWRTIPATVGKVWYGSSPGSLTSSVTGGLEADHKILISGLPSGERTYYAVGTPSGVLAGDDTEHFVHTAPPVGSTGPLRIWAIGDSGTADSSARAVRNAYYNFTGDTHTDLWLMLGDNAYASGSDDEYQSAVFDIYPSMLRKSVVWPTRGNHEVHGSVYYDIFSLPRAGEAGGVASGSEAYYSFDYANVHIICLDSEGSSRAVGGPMWSWLEADLGANTQDWIVTFWHHAPYTKGSHDSDTETELREMRQRFNPLLEDYAVDLVLSGHSHSYERSFLIDSHYGVSSTFDASMLIDGGNGQPQPLGDGAYLKTAGAHQGTVYTVAGSAGKTSSGPLDHPVMYHSVQQLGSVVIDVEGGRMDVKFLRSNGAVGDFFTLLSDQYTGSYCEVIAHSDGCEAVIVGSGTPSMSATGPYLIEAFSVKNDQYGLLFYGFGPASVPFWDGVRCVAGPLARMPIQFSGSSIFPCTGHFVQDINPRIQGGIDAGLAVGATVYSQYWFRDPGGSSGAALSNGLQFVIQP